MSTKLLPQYKCHKIVRASKIITIQRENNNAEFGAAHLILEEEGYPPLFMDAKWMQRHTPKAGDYLVQYDDEYMSASPAKEFEDGYTRIP